MSALAIIVIAILAVLVLLLIGGALGARRHARETDERLHARIAAADRALEEARAADRGWDRALLEQAARAALDSERPDFEYYDLHLVLVDDRPGTHEDRAQLAAIGDSGELRVVLTREGDRWVAESIG